MGTASGIDASREARPAHAATSSSSTRWSVATLAVCAVAIGYLVATASQPLRLDWGDPWSDVDIRIAGRFFAKYGFLQTRFAGIVDIAPLTPDSYRYLHYPPFGLLLNGALQSLFHTESLTFFRLVAVSVSASGLWFFFRYVQATFGHRAACLATIVFATNGLFLRYADCIYSHPLQIASGFASLALLARWLASGRRGALLAAGGAAFLCFFSSYDYYFFLPLMVVMTPLLVGRPLRDPRSVRGVLVIGAFCVAAVAVKCLLAIWAIGWPGFVQSIVFQFHERATSKYAFDCHASLPRIAWTRLEHFYSPMLFALLAIYAAAAIARVARRPVAWLPGPGPLAFLAAGLPFVVLLNQLFAEQYHASLSFLPFAAVGAGVLADQWLAASPRLGPALAAACVALPVAWGARDVATSPKTFLNDADLALVRAYLDANDANDFVYSNFDFSAGFRYYLNRQLLPAAHVAPRELPVEIAKVYGAVAERPIHYVHFDRVEDAAADCKVQSYTAVSLGRRDWLEDPWSTRAAWQSAVRARDAEVVSVLGSIATPVLRASGLTVYRIEPASVRAWLARRRSARTEVVAFGEESSGALLVKGFRFPEEGGGGFRWLVPVTPMRFVLTAGGVVLVPSGAETHAAEMLLDLPAGARYRIELEGWSAEPDQTLHVAFNDRPALADCRFGAPFAKTTCAFDVEPAALEAGGAQRVTLAFDRVSPFGTSVALHALRVTIPSPG